MTESGLAAALAGALAWLDARLASFEALEAVAGALAAHRYMAMTSGGETGCRGCTWTFWQPQSERGRRPHEGHAATAALAAVRGLLGVTDGEG